MATDGFDDLLAAYDMPDMATMLADEKQPKTPSQVSTATSTPVILTVSQASGKDQVNTSPSSPPYPLLSPNAAPRMASQPKAVQGFSGVSQVARNSPIWNNIPPRKTKQPATSRKSVSQRRPKARPRGDSRAFSYMSAEDGQNYQSFNLSDPALNSSCSSVNSSIPSLQCVLSVNSNVPLNSSGTSLNSGHGSLVDSNGPTCNVNVNNTMQQQVEPACKKPRATARKSVSLVQLTMKPNSDSQTNAKESGSVILSIPTLLAKANPLPTYKPPKPPAHLNIPDIQFTCTVCDDTFLFETSLECHMKRRSLFLKFDCSVCKTEIVFYNKCAFHRHIQDHLSAGDDMKIDTANFHFESLSFDVIKEGLDDLLVFSPDFDLNLGLSEKQATTGTSNSVGAPSPEVGSAGKAADQPTAESSCETQNQLVATSSHDEVYNPEVVGRYCWECSSTFKTKEEFLKHWSNNWELPSNSKHECNRCGLILPTACSLAAHSRLSRGPNGAPHVCPECGELFDTKSKLDDHARYHCFHYYRTVVYTCPVCRQFYKPEVCKRFNDRAAFKRHLMNHSDTYHKCKCCPMAFKSEAGLYGHTVATHAKEDAIQSPQLMIHKCPLCNTVFHQSALLTTHMSWHFEEIEKSLKYRFVCPFCMVKLGSFKTLNDHVWSAHTTVMLQKRTLDPTDSPVQITTGAAHADSHRKKAQQRAMVSPPEKSKVTKSCSELKEKDHVGGQKKKKLVARSSGPKYSLSSAVSETAAGSANQPSSSGLLSPVSPDGLSESETSVSIKGQYAPYECPICHSQYYYRDSLFKHRRVHEKEGKFICLLCSEVFNNKMAQVQHTRICFRIKKGMDCANTQVNMYTCEICDETFFCQDELQKHMQDLHSISVLQQFACLLCGLTYDEKANLEQHIEEAHKGTGKKPMYMCWICQDEKVTKGFGKRHLLEKHLQKEHKISKNQIDYSKMTKALAAVGGAEEGESTPQKEEVTDDSGKIRSPEEQEANSAATGAPIKRLKVEGDSVYNCAKCKFSVDDRKEFHKHITQHKNAKDGIQCLECGMSFIVEPSLRKHLFIVHKIKDYQKYISELGSTVPVFTDSALHVDVVGESEGQDKLSLSPASNPLECKVCYREFEDEARLKNHMRTHGMAFIRSKRANVMPTKKSPTTNDSL